MTLRTTPTIVQAVDDIPKIMSYGATLFALHWGQTRMSGTPLTGKSDFAGKHGDELVEKRHEKCRIRALLRDERTALNLQD